MTLEEFMITGRNVADLSTIDHLASQGMEGPGRVYAEDLVIAGTPGNWCLTIENDSRMGDLEALERALYDWAIDEGYLHPDAPAPT
jgi:hypothetical protein